MATARLKRNDWVLVSDGGRALVMRNDGKLGYPKLTMLRKHDQHAPPTRELGTDKPGRTHTGVGPSRSAMEPTDFHQQAEDRLMADVAASLAEDLRLQKFSSLVVAAAPTALGALRKAMTDELKKTVIAEIPKDFTRMNLVELGGAVSEALEAA